MENSCHVTIPQMSFLRQFFFFKFHIWPSSHVEFSNATKKSFVTCDFWEKIFKCEKLCAVDNDDDDGRHKMMTHDKLTTQKVNLDKIFDWLPVGNLITQNTTMI